MLTHAVRSTTLIAGFAIATLAATGQAGMYDSNGKSVQLSAEIMHKAQGLAARNARSFVSTDEWPFNPLGGVVANPTIYGKTYGEWGAEWWKWAYAAPEGENPVQDLTGEYCHVGQSGPVWFLAGTFGLKGVERHCTIPAGTAIFYPLVNATWVEEPGDDIYTDEEVRLVMATAYAGDRACKMTSTLNSFTTPNFGELPAPISAWMRPAVRSQSPKYTVDLPEGNVFGWPPGPNERLIAEGYWVMLPPLKPGEHTLTLYGSGCDQTGEKTLKQAFEVEVTYHLTVVPGRGPKP